MHILLPGGSGLIGRSLTDQLTKNQHLVTILSRNPSSVSNLPKGAKAIYWDGQTSQGWMDLVDQVDAIVNLAGNKLAGDNLWQILTQRWTTSQKQKIINSRLDPGAAIVQGVKSANHKPKVLLQASAVGYYGDRGNTMLYEDSPPGKGFIAQLCRDWEELTHEVEEFGVRHVVMRIGLVFSRQGGFLPVMILPSRFFIGTHMGTGTQYISWIHLDDTVAAIQFLIENNDSRGVYNLTAPQPIINAKFYNIALSILQRSAFFPIPGWGLRLLLGEKAELVLNGQRVIPSQLLQAGFNFKFQGITATLQDLLNTE